LLEDLARLVLVTAAAGGVALACAVVVHRATLAIWNRASGSMRLVLLVLPLALGWITLTLPIFAPLVVAQVRPVITTWPGLIVWLVSAAVFLIPSARYLGNGLRALPRGESPALSPGGGIVIGAFYAFVVALVVVGWGSLLAWIMGQGVKVPW
jgi:hypothetical protein